MSGRGALTDWRSRLLSAQPPPDRFWVLETCGRMVGSVAVSFSAEATAHAAAMLPPELLAQKPAPRLAALSRLVVAPEFRRRGFAAELTRAVETHCAEGGPTVVVL